MIKSNWSVIDTEISYACDSVAEAGQGVVVKTAGSGVAVGGSRGLCEVAAAASGKKFLGVVVHDVISLDTTRYTPNQYKDQTLVGAPCNIMKKGFLTTDQVTGSPTDGDTAYLTANGVFTPTVSATGGVAATPKAGTFRSAKDENGFAKIEFNLPN